jgi:hypothetical protein
VPNHSAEFIALLDAHLPDWRAAKAMLSELPYSHSGTAADIKETNTSSDHCQVLRVGG